MKYACPYCGKAVPDGIDHYTLFACCGEVGHAEEVKEEETAE